LIFSPVRHLCPCNSFYALPLFSFVHICSNQLSFLTRGIEARLLFWSYIIMPPIANDHDGHARLSRHCHMYFQWNTIAQFSFAWSIQIYSQEISFLRFFFFVIHDVSSMSGYQDTDVHQCMMHNRLFLAIEKINRKSYIKRIILYMDIDKLLTIV
jgi:hypothetical protein